jgi:hypothetical protein
VDETVRALPLMVAALCGINACASRDIYYWGHYEDLVYDMYVKPGAAEPGTQVAQLTEDIDKAHAVGKPVPPGVHAHLGYVYYQQGNLGQAEQEFQTEKTLFPESAPFIDGMLQRMKRQ